MSTQPGTFHRLVGHQALGRRRRTAQTPRPGAPAPSKVATTDSGTFSAPLELITAGPPILVALTRLAGAFQNMTSWGRLERALSVRAPLITVGRDHPEPEVEADPGPMFATSGP